MWRLTVERKYEYVSQFSGEKTEATDSVHFKANDLEDVSYIIGWFDTNATEGTYRFILEREEEEGEENA